MGMHWKHRSVHTGEHVPCPCPSMERKDNPRHHHKVVDGMIVSSCILVHGWQGQEQCRQGELCASLCPRKGHIHGHGLDVQTNEQHTSNEPWLVGTAQKTPRAKDWWWWWWWWWWWPRVVRGSRASRRCLRPEETLPHHQQQRKVGGEIQHTKERRWVSFRALVCVGCKEATQRARQRGERTESSKGESESTRPGDGHA